jgi:7,8-dihydroneopterin aldolase/epimerase/oxygenase
MNEELRLAFAHPVERAEATDERRNLLDRISLRDHVLEVEIGAFQLERGVTQKVRFNIVVEVAPLTEPVDDDVDRILSYDRVSEAITSALASERLNLLETLAERVADLVLREPQAIRVFVRIEKLDRGSGALGVEIVRAKVDAQIAAQKVHETLHPRVVYLTNMQIANRELPTVIDGLAADPTPLLICVGPPDEFAPQSAAALAQRRIDLLAIEQNAWVLAGHDLRCIVVETRTELDWAMKHGQISIWAPSKIVLDAIDGPDVGPWDGLALAAWFAGQVGAAELLLYCDEAVVSPVEVRRGTWPDLLP